MYRFSQDLDRLRHYFKHRAKFRGLRDDLDYERRADLFIRGGCDAPRRCCYRANGDMLMYDPLTRALAIFSEDGAILRTFHIRTHRQADLLFAKECDE